MEACRYYFEFAQRMLSEKRYNLANLFFVRSITHEPDFIIGLNGYAQNLRLNCKQYGRAIQIYTRIININPYFQYAYFRRGICRGHLHDFEGQYFDYSHHIFYSHPEAFDYVSRAFVSKRIGNLENVIADCKTALSIDPLIHGAARLMADAEKAILSKNLSSSYS